MNTIAVKVTRLTRGKATLLRAYQQQFQEAVLWAYAEAARTGVASPGALQQAFAQPLLRRGLPPRYVGAALMQVYRLLKTQPQESEEDPPQPSEQFLAAFTTELVSAGVPAAEARKQAEGLYRQALAQLPRETRARVPLTVHALDYELQASVSFNNWVLRLRTPSRDWLSLHLEVRPWQVDKLSRVCSYLELVLNERGDWYAAMHIYETIRPEKGVVPLTIRQGVPA